MATHDWPPGDYLPELPEILLSGYGQVFSLTQQLEPRIMRMQIERNRSPKTKMRLSLKSRQQAEKAKVKFIKLLEAWDAEHDKEKSNMSMQRKGKKESVAAKVRANITQMHSWQDVFASLREAEDHYSTSSKFRRLFRKGASRAEAVEPFLNLIPDTDYTSVVCGGIKFILGACSAANRSRQEIIALVESLPEKVESASQYAELYSSEPILQTATCQLYLKILTAMEAIIAFWTKDRSFEFLKPLFFQRTYRPLQAELDDVKKASDTVERTIQFCDRNRLLQIADRVGGTQTTVAEIKALLIEFFTQQSIKTKWIQEYLMQISQYKAESTKPRAYITPGEIIQALEAAFPSVLPSRDDSDATTHGPLQRVLQAGFSMAGPDQQRTSWTISDPKVFGWFKSRHSRALVVHGNCALQRISPLSFFCALLIESLRSLGPIVVLHHFCGLHPPSDHRDVGSAGSIVTAAFRGAVSNLTPVFLVSVLRKLIKALPRRQPVFLILDGINYYETREFGWETKRLVKKLVKLLGAGGALYKLLITSTTRVLDIDEYFENDEKLYVPVEPTPRGVGAANQQLKRRFTFGRSTRSQ
ncbi:uncharacterized protein BO95DRAFT_517750 [Aspergillus brunneoviolaceus CBS 621.78]|uniref:Uncharacterized protein n=1 Tax=Aspergillus brunneoviolaceus CBS 621.78 TaxID=1450534 RepID=A0ACD1FXN3_9EURO|nr:hypothetical protein BO95DRAFT_517750 [Aspergillus brunneoviolaceus CBS 621.78]RAH41703.1 hypothetical protein BO95DRAFT_517750 [Aspergillus brunneoviolaceus CBS 621.78]